MTTLNIPIDENVEKEAAEEKSSSDDSGETK